jgi:hypothetical protein
MVSLKGEKSTLEYLIRGGIQFYTSALFISQDLSHSRLSALNIQLLPCTEYQHPAVNS